MTHKDFAEQKAKQFRQLARNEWEIQCRTENYTDKNIRECYDRLLKLTFPNLKSEFKHLFQY